MNKLRILAVNSDVTILQYFGRLVSSWGHSVHTYVGCSLETATRILSRAADLTFDVAIVGTVMPGLDGQTLLELLHGTSSCTHLISADCGPCIETALELRKKGIEAQPLVCPFEPSDLQQILEGIVTNSRQISPENKPKDATVLRWGNMCVTTSVRPYVRHCSWCAAEIPKKSEALLLSGAAKGHPRFCSKECLQNWDSIYWQKLALARSGLAKKDAKSEANWLVRQRTLMGFGWSRTHHIPA